MMTDMAKQKALNLLGMATRARMLISGEEQVVQAIQQNRVYVVICTEDCSQNTQKKIKNKCLHYGIPFIQQFDTMTLSQAIGKKRSICGISNQGFAKSLLRIEGKTLK